MSITRSVVPDSDPRQLLVDALHWLWSLQLQIRRLAESTASEWSGLRDTTNDPRRLFSQTSLDEHLVLVVGRNLVRALARVREQHPSLGLGQDVESAIHRLRNVYEHWDEYDPSVHLEPKDKSRAVRALAGAHPDAKPWSISYGSDGPVIGNVLSLKNLLTQLDLLEQALLRLEKTSRRVSEHAG